MAKKLSGLTNLGKKTLKRGKSIVKKGNTLLKRNFGKRGTVKLKAQKGLSQIRGKMESTIDEKLRLEGELDSWSSANGSMLVCGLEVLERDHEILTAPVKVAVSDHAFVIDGWLQMRRSDEVTKALMDSCLHVDITPFEMEAGGGGHGHSDHHHEQQNLAQGSG